MEREDTEKEKVEGSGIKKIQESDAEAENGDMGSPDKLVLGDNGDIVDHKLPNISGRVSGPARRSSRGKWTEEEDKILMAAVEKYKGKCWKSIARCLPDRTDVQCLHRWQKVLDPKLVKGTWTKEEDDLIIELVGKHGNNKWAEIARRLPGRIGKQCRERWHNHLNPEINRSAWTDKEELILLQAHSVYGNRWAEIAKFLHGRTENSIKNHWNCSLKKKMQQCSPCASACGRRQLASPFLHCTTTEAGNRKALCVKESRGHKMKCGSLSDSCSLDLVHGYSRGTRICLRAPENENCSCPGWRTSIPIEPSFPSSTLIKRGGDGSGFSKRSVKRCNTILQQSKVSSNSFVVKNFNVQSSPSLERSKKFGHFVSCPFEYQLPLDVTDGGKNGHLTHRNAPLLNSDEIDRNPFRRQLGGASSWEYSGSNDSYGSQSYNSSFVMPKAGFDWKKENVNAMHKSLLDEYYTGLCYEPLQEKDVMVFLSTGGFPTTDSFIRMPSTSDAQNPRNLGKTLSAHNFPQSRLKNAAMSFKNIPSIIRRETRPEYTSEATTRVHSEIKFTSSFKVAGSSHSHSRLQAEHEVPYEGRKGPPLEYQNILNSPQKVRKLNYSSSIDAAVNKVWDLSSRWTHSKPAADSFDSDDESEDSSNSSES